MKRSLVATMIVLGGCCVLGEDLVRACGDKFLIFGSPGVSRRYESIYPSNILVVKGGAAGVVIDYDVLKETLERSGHKIEVIKSQAALASALAKRKFDAVLVEATDAKVAAPLVTTATSQPLLIGLLCNETATTLAATQEYACLRTPEKPANVMAALDGFLGQRKAARRAAR